MRDEVVLVTGGSSGIGLAAARLFAGHGARVFLAARASERLEAAVEAVGNGARALPADLADASQAGAMARALEAEAGRLDVLVNCAGQFEIGPVEREGFGLAERLIRINYLGTVAVIEACLPLLRRGSRRSIVNVSSIAGKVAPPYMAAYAGSKWALSGYTHALRQELRAEGIHVALISPGPVWTPMIEGRVHTRYYPVPPGLPILAPDDVAAAILRAVRRRSADVVIPRRMSPLLRLGMALPPVVDWFYRGLLAARRDRGEESALAGEPSPPPAEPRPETRPS